MKIISASRRTDMVAFHPSKLKTKIETNPDAFFVFWTKNPANLLRMPLNFTQSALQLTITGLGGTSIEPFVPAPEVAWASVTALIEKGFNPDLINWRLDPLIPGFTDCDTIHKMAFCAKKLGITRCMVSFITWYGAVQERWPEGKNTQISPREQRTMALKIKNILDGFGITLYGCAQPHLEGVVLPAKCIDGEYYGKITGYDFTTGKDEYQRKMCGCTPSVEFGTYTPCGHACRYCYANPAVVASTPQLDLFQP